MSQGRQVNTSVWLALRNHTFAGLWIASVVSGCCIAAHDTAATWLMNTLGATPFQLSLMTTFASLPFFLFTLPAGAISDLVDRRRLFIWTYLWLGVAAGLLALLSWAKLVNPAIILAAISLLGIGFAFNAPIWAATVPGIVRRSELASATTLAGVQMNLAGIVGPAIGGFLVPFLGTPFLFGLNALAFLAAAFVVNRLYHDRRPRDPHLESFFESFVTAAHYVRYSAHVQIILIRNFLFACFIAAVPALVPVIAFRGLKLAPEQLGIIYTSLGIGSLIGATFVLPLARANWSPNALTIFAGWLLALVYLALATVHSLWLFIPIVLVSGISWTIAASELWLAGQRVMPDWARGRINAVHMMSSQGGIALGGVFWGAAASYLPMQTLFVGGAVLLCVSLFIAVPLSINYSQRLKLEPASLDQVHDFEHEPAPKDGPIGLVIDYDIEPEQRDLFIQTARRARRIYLRHGASSYRIQEELESPGKFRVEAIVASWAMHLRQHARFTKPESEVLWKLWQMHKGPGEPRVRHYIAADRLSTPLGFMQTLDALVSGRELPDMTDRADTPAEDT
jgi:MFS family permease